MSYKYKATNELQPGDHIPCLQGVVIAVVPASTFDNDTIHYHRTVTMSDGSVLDEPNDEYTCNQWNAWPVEVVANGIAPTFADLMDYTHRVYPLMLAAHDPLMPQSLFNQLHALGYC